MPDLQFGCDAWVVGFAGGNGVVSCRNFWLQSLFRKHGQLLQNASVRHVQSAGVRLVQTLVLGSGNRKTCTSGPGSGNRKTCTSGPCPRLQFHTSILQASAEEKHRLPRRYAPRRDGVMFRRHGQLLRGGEGWQFGKLYCHGFTRCNDEGFTIYDYLIALVDYTCGNTYAKFW